MILTRGLGPSVTLVASGIGPWARRVIFEGTKAFTVQLIGLFPALAAQFTMPTPLVCDSASISYMPGRARIDFGLAGDPQASTAPGGDAKVEPAIDGKPRAL